MAFILHTSDHIDHLINEELDSLLDQGPDDPFQPNRIVVQSRGMSDYLKKKLTAKRGVLCNLDLPFLNNFVNDILENSLDDPPEIDFFQPEIMCWNIYSILEEIESKYPILQNYIDGSNEELKRFQLADKIANVFDNYQIYRPHLLLKWEQGDISKNEKWQAEIWCKLAEEHVSRARGFYQFITDSEVNVEINQSPINVFGVSTLPPLYIQFFKKLSKSVDVHFFKFSWLPDNDDLSLTRDEGEYSELFRFDLKQSIAQQDNQFLESNGKTGLEFELLLRNTADKCKITRTDNDKDHLLARFQKSILNDRDSILICKDDSIQIHKVHNKIREVETLYNSLLNILDKDSTITPGDITVIIPEIEEYIPYIKAVFNRYDEKNDKHLPFRIADQTVLSFQKFVETFTDLLDIKNSRFKASYILKILENDMVRETFDIEEEELELINKWVEESGIRWGIDEKHHQKYGHSEFKENSWQFGLDRMLLGYAMSNETQLYSDILPYDEIEGQNSNTLGNFISFVKELINIDEKFRNKYTHQKWYQIIIELIDTFFISDNENYGYTFELKNRLENLFDKIDVNDGKFGIDVMANYLKSNLISESSSRGYFRGEITIGSTQHLHGIPARVVCLLGLNQGQFPRIDNQLSFDIYKDQEWLGDRSKRNEDRDIFLRSLMAAQNYFYVSYIGYNEKNEELPPSSIVSDLFDFLRDSADSDQQFEKLQDNIHINHKLKSYAPEYFKEQDKLISYFEDDLEAARVLQQTDRTRKFFNSDEGLSFDEEPIEEEIDVQDLIKFFKNPAKFFTRRRLGLKYPSDKDREIDDLEPIDLDGLDNYTMDSTILNGIIEEKEQEEAYQILKGEGKLPVKNRSQTVFDEHYQYLNQEFNKKYSEIDTSPLELIKKVDDHYIKIEVDSKIIHGNFTSVYDNMNIFWRPGKLKGKNAVEMWVNHLLLSIALDKEVKTLAFYKDKSDYICYLIQPIPLELAKKGLKNMVEIYCKGQKQPLPFFPNSSYKKYQGEGTSKAWGGDSYKGIPGEYDDKYVQLYFEKETVESEKFSKLADKFFAKLNDYLTKVKHAE